MYTFCIGSTGLPKTSIQNVSGDVMEFCDELTDICSQLKTERKIQGKYTKMQTKNMLRRYDMPGW